MITLIILTYVCDIYIYIHINTDLYIHKHNQTYINYSISSYALHIILIYMIISLGG
jgi:hypothetical protein